MNWKIEAVEKLKMYEVKKKALSNIPLEIERLESEMVGLRSPKAGEASSGGGGGSRDGAYLSNIVQREELGRMLKQAEMWCALVDAGLEILNEEERLILDRFYIHPEKGVADRLAGDLRVDIKTVYHRKDAALRRFTISLYGGTEG